MHGRNGARSFFLEEHTSRITTVVIIHPCGWGRERRTREVSLVAVLTRRDVAQGDEITASCLLRVIAQFSSVTQSCPTLCDPMNRSTPGLPVHHQVPEFTQTHVHRVGDAIQPSHPLSSPSPPAPNPSQHQGLFQWVDSLHEVASVLEFQP